MGHSSFRHKHYQGRTLALAYGKNCSKVPGWTLLCLCNSKIATIAHCKSPMSDYAVIMTHQVSTTSTTMCCDLPYSLIALFCNSQTRTATPVGLVKLLACFFLQTSFDRFDVWAVLGGKMQPPPAIICKNACSHFLCIPCVLHHFYGLSGIFCFCWSSGACFVGYVWELRSVCILWPFALFPTAPHP